ncbi:MAG: hypothetical protein M3083_23085, partial [Actinomycetota bacterium]|nr:hypothetical protein [Actinomycetota bacterium]
ARADAAPAGPALADLAALAANISISGPPAGSLLGSTSVTITGNANIDPGLLGRNAITAIHVAVAFEGTPFDSCDNTGCGAAVGQASTSFAFTPGALSRNGPYSVTATVTANEYILGGPLGPATRTGSATTNFNVGIPPGVPGNVTAHVNGDGTVTLSWARNGEPDLYGYQVQRQDVGSPGLKLVAAAVGQPSGGSTVSWTDSGSRSGGDFGYVVTALRPGPDGTSSHALFTASSAAPASVPVPVPVTTIPVVGQGPRPTTTTSVAPQTSTSPDVSGFVAQASKTGAIPALPPQAQGPAPSGSIPAGPPDTYAPTLPYPSARRASGSGAGAGAPKVALPGRPSALRRHRSLLFSIAGGLLLCVLGLVVRATNRGSRSVPLEALGSADGGATPDAGSLDAGSADAGWLDAGSADAGPLDAGSADAGSADAGSDDAGSDDAESFEVLWPVAVSPDVESSDVESFEILWPLAVSPEVVPPDVELSEVLWPVGVSADPVSAVGAWPDAEWPDAEWPDGMSPDFWTTALSAGAAWADAGAGDPPPLDAGLAEPLSPGTAEHVEEAAVATPEPTQANVPPPSLAALELGNALSDPAPAEAGDYFRLIRENQPLVENVDPIEMASPAGL